MKSVLCTFANTLDNDYFHFQTINVFLSIIFVYKKNIINKSMCPAAKDLTTE